MVKMNEIMFFAINAVALAYLFLASKYRDIDFVFCALAGIKFLFLVAWIAQTQIFTGFVYAVSIILYLIIALIFIVYSVYRVTGVVNE